MHDENVFDANRDYVCTLRHAYDMHPGTPDEKQQVKFLRWQSAVYSIANKQEQLLSSRCDGTDHSAVLAYNIIRQSKNNLQIAAFDLTHTAYNTKPLEAVLISFITGKGDITLLTNADNFEQSNTVIDTLKTYATSHEYNDHIHIYLTDELPMVASQNFNPNQSTHSGAIVIGDDRMYAAECNSQNHYLFSFNDVEKSGNLALAFQTSLKTATKQTLANPEKIAEQRQNLKKLAEQNSITNRFKRIFGLGQKLTA